MFSVIIGSVGVGLLLVAFVLNLMRVIGERSPAYLVMNFVGAGTACWYAWASDLIPFVVLEGFWALSALVRLILTMKNPGLKTGAHSSD